ncbi:MAG: hypothetical protein ABIG08_03420 [bacterium]
MPNSIRKFIRSEKARIRREVLDVKKQKELIEEVYQKLTRKNDGKRDIQLSDK